MSKRVLWGWGIREEVRKMNEAPNLKSDGCIDFAVWLYTTIVLVDV